MDTKLIGAGTTIEEITSRVRALKAGIYAGEYGIDYFLLSKSVRELVVQNSTADLKQMKTRFDPEENREKRVTISKVDWAFKEAQNADKIPNGSSEITYLWNDGLPKFYEKGMLPDYDYYWQKQIVPPVRRIVTSIWPSWEIEPPKPKKARKSSKSLKQLTPKDFGVKNLRGEIVEYSPAEIHPYKRSEEASFESYFALTVRALEPLIPVERGVFED